MEWLSETLGLLEEYSMAVRSVTIRLDVPVGFTEPYDVVTVEFQALEREGKL